MPDEATQQPQHTAPHIEEEPSFIEAVQRGETAPHRGEYLTHQELGQRLARFRA